MRDSEEHKAGVTDGEIARDQAARSGTGSTLEVANYVLETAKGLRNVTRLAGRRDLAFLDYLLAMAEDEATNLAARAYH